VSDTRDEQPAVGGWAKCIHCGTRSVLLLCEKCAAQATEEHVARQRALKENGRLRTERLAREAAAGEAAASPAPKTAFGAAHGWPSLRWTAEKPKAAGWWYVELFDGRKDIAFVMQRSGEELSCGTFAIPGWHWVSDTFFRRWAGPLPEPVDAPDEEPTANGVLCNEGRAAKNEG
jgi:hypothetical protein